MTLLTKKIQRSNFESENFLPRLLKLVLGSLQRVPSQTVSNLKMKIISGDLKAKPFNLKFNNLDLYRITRINKADYTFIRY